MEKVFAIGVFGILLIFISTILFRSEYIWLAGLILILLLLIIRWSLGELSQKADRLMILLTFGITIITIIFTITTKNH